MKCSRYWQIAAILSLTILFSPPSSLAKEMAEYSVKDCIEMAVKFSPEIQQKRQDLEIAKTRLAEAEGYQWPQLEILALGGPSPQAHASSPGPGGWIDSSPYRNDKIRGIGIFGSADIKIVQPIYTFGRISEAKKAAEHGIKVERSMVQQKATEVALEINKYYYGHLAALEGKKLVGEIDGYLKSTMDKTKKLLEAGSEYATELDLYKLEAFQGMLDKYREEANRDAILSKEALRTFIGLGKNAEFDLQDKTLEPVGDAVDDFNVYVAKSKEFRPEFTQLKEAIQAKDSLYKMAYADYFPKIFAVGFYSYADASDRDRVTNAFIFDYFRHSVGGVALGLKWDIDFGITKSKANRALADRLKYERISDYANIGIPLQVEKSYRELMESKQNIESTKKAYQSARKWMVGAILNYDMGVSDVKDAADGLLAYGTIKKEYIMSVYNYNMSHANVLHASGLAASRVKIEVDK
ncbi:MAG: TolC family protein [Actinobacteria bacterium]|nr:TolC family protein [Actinomycetota bacterium]